MAETDQIKWRGIQPVQPLQNIQIHPGPFETSVSGTTRAQILKYKEATDEEAIIHTVTGGKTFYLVACSLSLFHTAPDYAFIRIRNGSDTEVTRILDVRSTIGSPGNNSKIFLMPISIAATYDVTIFVDTGSGMASIEGWEE
jgi:hypothetical protein